MTHQRSLKRRLAAALSCWLAAPSLSSGETVAVSTTDNDAVRMPSLIGERHTQQFVFWGVHGVYFALAGAMAFLLCFDLKVPSDYLPHLIAGVGTWLAVRLAVFHIAGLDREWVPPYTVSDIARLVFLNAEASVFAATLIVLLGPPGFPRATYFTEFALAVLGTVGIQLSLGWWMDRAKNVSLETARGQRTIP